MDPVFPPTPIYEDSQQRKVNATEGRVHGVSKGICQPPPRLAAPLKLPQYLTEPDPVEDDADILASMLSYIDAKKTSERTAANWNPTLSHSSSTEAPSLTRSLPTLGARVETQAAAYRLELDQELNDEELEEYIDRSGAQPMLKEVRALSISTISTVLCSNASIYRHLLPSNLHGRSLHSTRQKSSLLVTAQATPPAPAR